jgi:hypothetical protein
VQFAPEQKESCDHFTFKIIDSAGVGNGGGPEKKKGSNRRKRNLNRVTAEEFSQEKS